MSDMFLNIVIGFPLLFATGWIFILMWLAGHESMQGLALAALLVYGVAAAIFLLYQAATGFKHIDVDKLFAW